jgi:hypothetical protein
MWVKLINRLQRQLKGKTPFRQELLQALASRGLASRLLFKDFKEMISNLCAFFFEVGLS